MRTVWLSCFCRVSIMNIPIVLNKPHRTSDDREEVCLSCVDRVSIVFNTPIVLNKPHKTSGDRERRCVFRVSIVCLSR